MKKTILFLILSIIPTFAIAAPPIFISEYEKAIESERKVLLILGVDWCGGCVSLKRDINQINLDDYVVCVVDAEEEKEIAKKYKIRSYPTSIIIKNKKEVSKKIGYRKTEFENWLDKNR